MYIFDKYKLKKITPVLTVISNPPNFSFSDKLQVKRMNDIHEYMKLYMTQDIYDNFIK